MLSAYEYKTTLYTIEDFFLKINALEPYDLIFLDEKLFNATVIKALEKLSKKSDLKIIALNNFFNPIDAHYYTKAADYKLLKPTTRGTVKRLLEKIYLPQEEQEALAQQESRTTNLKIYKHDFAKTPDVSIDTFALFKGLKLLIVEDDIINQKVLLGVLKRSGMEIDIANNGEECLEILKEKKHYDLILMDINMPKMDGYSATREIRKNSEYDSIPIISLTALISADEISKMFDVGMNAHLAKPLHKEKLFTAFDMFLTQTNDSVELPKQIKEPKTSFEGLNIQKGIQQANNNEEFYREILAEFLATYQDSAQLFEKLITDFRYEQVRMLCLDIKGLSGIIGATELHTLMYDIHHQLVFKKFDMLHGYVKPFYEKVELVNESIKEYLES
jgi:CheY-like chemotaxis protein